MKSPRSPREKPKKPDMPASKGIEKQSSDKELFSTLIDIFVKSNQLLNVYYIDQIESYDKKSKEEKDKSEYKPPPLEQLKYIEMQMNKQIDLRRKKELLF